MVDRGQGVWNRSARSLHVWVVLAFLIMLVATAATGASANATPANEKCYFNDNQIKVSVALGKPQLRVGDFLSINYVVSGINSSVNHLAIVIEFPAESRFKGSGFFATIPGSKGPLGIRLSAGGTSAIVPFSWKSAALSGGVGWFPLKAERTQLHWRLVATSPCSPQDVLSGVLPPIVVWPGDAKIVQHDVFGQESPLRRVRNPQGTRELFVFKDRYRVASADNGQVLFDSPGVNPSFTTSGRFVTSSRFDAQESGSFSQNRDVERQIVDAVDGKIIWSGAAGYIVFAQNDSLVILGNALGEKFFLMSTIVSSDKANAASISMTDYQGQFTGEMRMILSCSTYDNKEDDSDRVFALDFEQGAANFSLTSPEDFDDDDINFKKLFVVPLLSAGVDMSKRGEDRNTILSHGTVTKLVKIADETSFGENGSNPTASSFVPDWSIGQPVVLEQDLWNMRGRRRPVVGTVLPLDSAVAATSARPASTKSVADSSNDGADAAETFDTLESIGLRFSTPVQVKRFRMPSLADDSQAVLSAGKAARASILSQKFGLVASDIQALFQEKKADRPKRPEFCNADEYGNDSNPEWMGLRHLDFAAKITVTSGAYSLLQFSCFQGSGFAAGGRTLKRKLFLFTLNKGKPLARDLEAALGFDSPVLSGGQRQAASAKSDVYGAGGNTVLFSSAGNPEPVLFDLELCKVIGGKISLSHPELLKAVRLSDDEKTLIQLNRDGSVYAYDVKSGDALLSGSVVDGEAVLATSEGYFDSTYEGTYNVRVRFEGLGSDYSFEQFASVLRVHDLVRLVLSRKGGLPQPKIMSPPIVVVSIAENNAPDPLHLQSVQIHAAVRSEAARLHSLAIFVDGRLVRSELIQGSAIERDFAVDANAGSAIAFVASDERGLRSLPALLQAPGKRRPTGALRVLSVGVDVYDDPKLPSLHSAANDARKIAQVLAGERGKRFARVEVQMLPDGHATPEVILEVLKTMVQTAADEDAIVVFFAAHGLEVRASSGGTKPGGMYIALKRTVFERITETALSWSRIAQALAPSKVPVVVFLDACHGGLAGQEVDTVNDFGASRLMTVRGSPIAIFAASKRRQVSRTSDGAGLFTRAIVENLRSRPANSVSVSKLYRSVRAAVHRQTNGRQTPWLARNETIGDLLLF